MSSLIKNKKDRFIRELSKNTETYMSVFTFLIFLVISVVIIKEINPTKEDVPNYFELSKNPYIKYEELLNRKDLKKIMDNKQFLEMRYDENVIKKEDSLEKEDPFAERFDNEYDNENNENKNEGESENKNNENNENNENDENGENGENGENINEEKNNEN